ncbi:flagellar basal-body rod protein FlgF [Ancylobacter lacus]|uniref:flagellar basal-body rod protein FlgF n=1 Tax=Ancylobacter lacus TaxID=2579970 RepID=UPI001BCCB261|nr:flagellar basal-body rod protein FlgF [Ancylobacter lacus]
MSSGLYVALSAQMAMERRLNTIASNVANMNTPGYRAEEIKFSALLSKAGKAEVAYSSANESYTSTRAGQVTYTGNPLDVAPQGDAWFAVQTPAGRAYTRDGRLQMSATGELKTVDNFPMLDAGGTMLMLDPAGGAPTIGADGAITQGGNIVGSIGLYQIPASAKLTRNGASTVIPDKPAQAVQDFSAVGVRQGYVEGSNVEPIQEMSRLIMVQRAFEMAASAVQLNEDSTSEAIRSLGPA